MSNELAQIVTILRTLMAFRDLTMTELAERVGMKAPMLSKRMSGRIPFTFNELVAMAGALRVDPKVWFDEPENALTYLRPEPQNWKPKNTPATAQVQALRVTDADDEVLANAV